MSFDVFVNKRKLREALQYQKIEVKNSYFSRIDVVKDRLKSENVFINPRDFKDKKSRNRNKSIFIENYINDFSDELNIRFNSFFTFSIWYKKFEKKRHINLKKKFLYFFFCWVLLK